MRKWERAEGRGHSAGGIAQKAEDRRRKTDDGSGNDLKWEVGMRKWERAKRVGHGAWRMAQSAERNEGVRCQKAESRRQKTDDG